MELQTKIAVRQSSSDDDSLSRSPLVGSIYFSQQEKRNVEHATLPQSQWGEMYRRLIEYKQKHGHCRVPYRFHDDPQLGAWVALQRRQHKLSGSKNKNALSSDKEKQLNQIGFEWSVETRWELRFIELLHFVAINGHAQVPTKWKQHRKISNWVSTQRREYKNLKTGRSSSLTKERIQLLQSIGFVWEAERGGTKRLGDGNNVRAPEKTVDCVASPVFKATAERLLKNLRGCSTQPDSIEKLLAAIPKSIHPPTEQSSAKRSPAALSELDKIKLSLLAGKLGFQSTVVETQNTMLSRLLPTDMQSELNALHIAQNQAMRSQQILHALQQKEQIHALEQAASVFPSLLPVHQMISNTGITCPNLLTQMDFNTELKNILQQHRYV